QAPFIIRHSRTAVRTADSSPPPHKKATAKRSSQNIVLPKTGTIMLLFLSFVKYSSAFVQKHTDIS
ncbi:hypothetical protein, partial [Dysosmobacter sp.]|uniref:hypothetical protein n=1 Tax=Dysosmobacter sp. TaxID=2591382 RepID=UPI003AAC2C23